MRWIKRMILAAVVAGGCTRNEGTTLDRDAFYRPPAGTTEERHVLQDRPASPTFNTFRMDLLDGTGRPTLIPQEPPPPQESVQTISPEVAEAVKLPTVSGDGLPAAFPPATAPTISPPRVGVPGGVAVLVGAVVCEVNGSPIYADKVLASLSKVFAAEAKQRDYRSFREYARSEIERQVRTFVSAELEYALAEKNLDPREKQLAGDLTARWRQQQITQAGGSLERAKARAAADGWDFEERVNEEYRTNMVRIFYQKKIFPQAQVRADDMRKYYYDNLQREFTEFDQAQFRLIKVDIERTGSEQAAREKIQNLRARAVKGEDFASLASSVNDDASLMRAGGDVGWVQRGAFLLEEVENAVWNIAPGEVTEVIRVDDAFYIAKLENRKTGRVQPFEEQAVQDRISETLRKQQITALRQRQQQELIKNAIIHPDPPDVTPVLEMAMQRYAEWAGNETR